MLPIPELHPLKDVAARLHVTPRRLKEHLRLHPLGRKIGRQILFTDSDVLALINSLECVGGGRRTYVLPMPTRSGRYQAQTSDPQLQAVLERLAAKKPKMPRSR